MGKKTASLLYLALALVGVALTGATLWYALARLPSLSEAGKMAQALPWVCAGGLMGLFCLIAPVVYLFSGSVLRRMEMADKDDGEEEDPSKGEA